MITFAICLLGVANILLALDVIRLKKVLRGVVFRQQLEAELHHRLIDTLNDLGAALDDV